MEMKFLAKMFFVLTQLFSMYGSQSTWHPELQSNFHLTGLRGCRTSNVSNAYDTEYRLTM